MVSLSSSAFSLVIAFWLISMPAAFAADSTDANPNPPVSSAVPSQAGERSTNSFKATQSTKRAVHKEVKAEAIGEVDGVPLDKNASKPEKNGFSIGDLNPLKYIFAPITDVQKEVKTLTKQITEIETPINELQEPMVGLREDMVNVSGQVGQIRTGITGVHKQMNGVDGKLERMEKKLEQIYEPIAELKDPVNGIAVPVNKLHGNITSIMSDMKGINQVVGTTSGAIVLAVVAIGLLVVVGTPIAAMVVWKHRSMILSKLGGTEEDIADLQAASEKIGKAAEKEERETALKP